MVYCNGVLATLNLAFTPGTQLLKAHTGQQLINLDN
jgi:hypothetical protein